MSEDRKILIYGSCVSRDIFNEVNSSRFSIVDYVARSSMASAFDSLPLVDRHSSGLSSPFQRRLVKLDWEKSFSSDFYNNSFDILLVDFIDERLNIFAFDSGGVCTISNELVNAGFKKNLETGREIKSGTDEFYERWEAGWSLFVGKLREHGLFDKLRINKVYWGKLKEDGSSFDDSVGYIAIDAANNFLERLYARAALDVPTEQFLCFAPEFMVGALDHRWGVSPFHYIKDYYRSALSLLASNPKET